MSAPQRPRSRLKGHGRYLKGFGCVPLSFPLKARRANYSGRWHPPPSLSLCVGGVKRRVEKESLRVQLGPWCCERYS